jgi:hypothetical protein
LSRPPANVQLALTLGAVAVAVYLTYIVLRLLERGG